MHQAADTQLTFTKRFTNASQTLAVPKMKSDFHRENKKMLEIQAKFSISYISSAFHYGTHNLTSEKSGKFM